MWACNDLLGSLVLDSPTVDAKITKTIEEITHSVKQYLEAVRETNEELRSSAENYIQDLETQIIELERLQNDWKSLHTTE